MKILYFHQHFTTPQGVVGVRSYQMARALVAHGHQVVMVCGSYNGGVTGITGPFKRGRRRGVVNGINVIEFDLSYSNRDGFAKRTATFLRFALGSIGIALREPHDIVFATTTPLTAGIPGIFARWCRRKPFVFEVRDLWPELPRAMKVIRNPLVLGALSLLEWLSYHSAHRCIALAPGIAEGIEARGIPADRILTIPNGCDLEIFGSNESPWRPAGIAPDQLLAVFAGTHGPANGLDAVLDAASVLMDRGRHDIAILLMGDGKLKIELQRRVAKENLTNVHFHSPVGKGRLAGLMQDADIGLQILANVPAFYYGTSPNKFFDYIAAGLPVLNNYPGWLADMIAENDCGFVVPAGEPNAFADALIAASDDRSALKHKGSNARRLAETTFSREALAEKWIDFVVEAPLA